MPQLALTATVGASSGLHARPASLFVQAAARQSVKVTIGRPGQSPVDARSLLSVLALAAAHGDTLELATESDDAQAAQGALDELAAILATDHDEAA